MNLVGLQPLTCVYLPLSKPYTRPQAQKRLPASFSRLLHRLAIDNSGTTGFRGSTSLLTDLFVGAVGGSSADKFLVFASAYKN